MPTNNSIDLSDIKHNSTGMNSVFICFLNTRPKSNYLWHIMKIPSIIIIYLISPENNINEALIPKPSAYGCPQGTFDSLNTCYCEDHCSWETCRLLNPPQNCLSNTANESAWAWDSQKGAWVAQSKYQI